MNPENELNNQPVIVEPQNRKLRKRPFANIFLVVALLLCLFGLYKTFAYGSDDKLVGGDAYNFIILAGRGTALICAGIVSALTGVAIAIYDLTDQQS